MPMRTFTLVSHGPVKIAVLDFDNVTVRTQGCARLVKRLPLQLAANFKIYGARKRF